MSYAKCASVYDAIYTAKKDYPQEAAHILDLLSQYFPGARSLLEVAIGTGLHAQVFQTRYLLTGCDLSPEQLAIAAVRLPGIPLYQADMCTLQLPGTYDVGTCLFSAIGHMTTIKDLRLAISAMANKCRLGFIIEPWLHPEDVKDGAVHTDVATQGSITVQRMSYATLQRNGRLTRLEMHHQVGRSGEGVERFVEVHHLGNFTDVEYQDAIRDAGLTPHHITPGLSGRGLYLATR